MGEKQGHTPDLDRQADIATDASIAALEAAIKSVTAERLGEDEAIGILTGLLRAAGRWASFTINPAMDEGIHIMLARVLEQERAARASNPGETMQ